MSRFKPATREKLRLRMALDGPSGAGKSVTALRLATVLANQGAGRIAVIDTESGSARLYIGEDFGEGPFAFDVVELDTFSPDRYTELIEEAGREKYDVIVIDSLSHAWEGKDGALELKERVKGGNQFTAWKDVTPMHRRMVEAILHSPCHVFCTMRSKVEYVLERNEAGKEVPRKVGTAPVQRWGMEYEFGIYGSMDWSHIMTVTKSRCRAVDGAVVLKPGAAFMAQVIDWLESGTAPAPAQKATISDEDQGRVVLLAKQLGWNMDRVRKELPKRCGVQELRDVPLDKAAAVLRWLEGAMADAKQKAEAARVEAGPPMTAEQRDQIDGFLEQCGHTTEAFAAKVRAKYGVSPEQMSQKHASEVIAAYESQLTRNAQKVEVSA